MIRGYTELDAKGWLRCRVLAFLDTQYYDDVKAEPTQFEGDAIRLIASASDDLVVGVLDIEIDGQAATIDTVAVHPDHRRAHWASRLLEAAEPLLVNRGVTTLDAWTREDGPANGWYRANGFVEQFRYLHVHKEWNDEAAGFASPPGLSEPIRAFAHAPIEREAELRAVFPRVYACRQYLRHEPFTG